MHGFRCDELQALYQKENASGMAGNNVHKIKSTYESFKNAANIWLTI
jgi:hypothetical protein